MVPLWALLMAAVLELHVCKEECVSVGLFWGNLSLCRTQPQCETDKGVPRLGNGEVTAGNPTKTQAGVVRDHIPALGGGWRRGEWIHIYFSVFALKMCSCITCVDRKDKYSKKKMRYLYCFDMERIPKHNAN